MKCPNCQQETKATKFCTNCGKSLHADTAPTPLSQNQKEDLTNENLSDKQTSSTDKEKGKDQKSVQPIKEDQSSDLLGEKANQKLQQTSKQKVSEEKEKLEAYKRNELEEQQKEKSNKKRDESQENQPEKSPQSPNEEPQEIKKTKEKLSLNGKTPVKYLLFSFILIILAAGYSTLMQFAFKGSQLFKDFFYRFLYNVVGIEQDVAVAFASAKTISWWDVLAASFGTTVTGSLKETYIDGQMGSLSFVFHAPLIFPSLLMLVVLFIGWKILKRWSHASAKIRLLEIISTSLLFSGILYVLLWALKPNISYGNLEILFAPKPLSLIVSAFILSLLAGLFAFGPFEFQSGTKLKNLSALKPLKVFFFYFIGLQALVGILMVAVWMFSSPSTLFEFPTLSPSMVWHEYKIDPLFYVILPNIMLFETFYSVGGSLQITSMEFAQALSMQEPIQLNLFTGVSSMLESSQAGEWIQELSHSLRLVWHPYALLVIFLTSLSMARVKGKISSLLILIGGFSLSGILLTLWMNITFAKVETGESMMIGFQPLQIFVSVFILCFIIFAASYSLSHFIEKKVRRKNE